MARSLKEVLGFNELTSSSSNIWRSVLAEFVGIFILNFFGCASCISGETTTIALAFGLAIFMAVMTVGHVSGGHINPAVTCGMLVGGKIKLVRAILYIIAQCAGATAGTSSLRALYLDSAYQTGHTFIQHIKPLQGLGVEFFLGFLLVLCVYGVCDGNKPDHRFIAPLAIGLTVTLGHLGAVKMTGASMNPARTFGTALVYNNWSDHWVYWAGPILGGITAALLYTQALAAPAVEIPIAEKYRTNADEKEMRRLDTKGEFA